MPTICIHADDSSPDPAGAPSGRYLAQKPGKPQESGPSPHKQSSSGADDETNSDHFSRRGWGERRRCELVGVCVCP